MIELRPLEASELARVREIDRTEVIDAIYVQRGAQLELRHGDFSSPAWKSGGGPHSVAEAREALADWVNRGGIAIGAFESDALVGVGLVLPHLRPDVAQLAFLYVTAARRGTGIGVELCGALEALAREAGNRSLVVSATPSLNTVRFYERRGFRPMAEPLPELFALEPEDVHMQKEL